MNDQISRQRLIEYVQLQIDHYKEGGIKRLDKEERGVVRGLEMLMGIIHDYECELSQPPASQWIPCSERLPDEPDFYLATVINGQGEATTQKMLFNGKGWHRDMPWEITAWQPLPEPYKGE